MAGRNIDEKLRCSFCNKTQDQVKKLIAGHNGVYICDECVEICSDILDEEFETDGGDVDHDDYSFDSLGVDSTGFYITKSFLKFYDMVLKMEE